MNYSQTFIGIILVILLQLYQHKTPQRQLTTIGTIGHKNQLKKNTIDKHIKTFLKF